MSSTDPSPTLLLVDGHAYAYRAFYAIRSLNSPDGAPTNAIYGFVKMLQKMETILRPTHRLVLWDRGLAAERMASLACPVGLDSIAGKEPAVVAVAVAAQLLGLPAGGHQP